MQAITGTSFDPWFITLHSGVYVTGVNKICKNERDFIQL